MDATARRIVLLLLIFAGAVGSHAVGYSVSGAASTVGTTTGHGYMDVASLVLAPLSAVAVAWIAVRQARRSELAHLHPMRMAAAQALLFVLVEVFERLPAGTAATTLSEPAVIVGLLVTIPVAYALAYLAVVTRLVVVALRRPREKAAAQKSVLPAPGTEPAAHERQSALRHTISRRGPPFEPASA